MARKSTASQSFQSFCKIFFALSEFRQGVSLAGNSDSLISDGECDQNSAPRAFNT